MKNMEGRRLVSSACGLLGNARCFFEIVCYNTTGKLAVYSKNTSGLFRNFITGV